VRMWACCAIGVPGGVLSRRDRLQMPRPVLLGRSEGALVPKQHAGAPPFSSTSPADKLPRSSGALGGATCLAPGPPAHQVVGAVKEPGSDERVVA
jgi:hypothetical protein